MKRSHPTAVVNAWGVVPWAPSSRAVLHAMNGAGGSLCGRFATLQVELAGTERRRCAICARRARKLDRSCGKAES